MPGLPGMGGPGRARAPKQRKAAGQEQGPLGSQRQPGQAGRGRPGRTARRPARLPHRRRSSSQPSSRTCCRRPRGDRARAGQGRSPAPARPRGRAARWRAPRPLRRGRPGHVRARARRDDGRRGLDHPGAGRRALPHRPGPHGAVPPEEQEAQAIIERTAGTLLVRDAGSAADTRWIDDREDLPRIIRAGRHIARTRRYIPELRRGDRARGPGQRGRATGRPRGRLGQARRRLDRS